MQDEQTCSVDAGVHIGEHIGDALVLDNLLAKLCTVVGIGECRFKRSTRNAERLCCDADAATFQIGERNRQPLAARAKQMIFGDRTVVEQDRASIGGADTELFFRWLHIEAWRIGRHDKCGQPFFTEIGISHRKHDSDMCTFAVGDKLLGAVQYPLAIDKFGRGLEIIGF